MTEPIRILFVDNQVDVRDWLAERLRRNYQFEVDCADNGKLAMERVTAAQGNYDVALVDMRLGVGPDGIDVMKSIKSSYSDIEVIIVTGFGDEEDGVRAMLEGACNYVFKPWRDEELVVYIRAAAERHRLKTAEQERAWLQSIFDVSQAATKHLDPDAVAREICEKMVNLIPAADLLYTAIYDEERDEVRFVWVVDKNGRKDIPARQLADQENWGLGGYVIKTKEPKFLDDLDRAERQLPIRRKNPFGVKAKSFIGIPLISREKIIGVLSAISYKTDAFTLDHYRLLQAIANQVAVAVDNANQHQQTSHQLEILSRLYKILTTLRTKLKLTDVLNEIVNNLRDLFSLDTCTVGLFDESLIAVDFIVTRGLPVQNVKRQLKIFPRDVREKMFESSNPIIISDLKQRLDFAEILVRKDLNSFVLLPLHGKKEPLGIVTMGSRTRSSLTEEQIDLLRALADQAAIAIENARLHEETSVWAQQLDRLDQGALDIASEMESTKLLRIVANKVVALLDAAGSGVYLLTKDEKEFELVAAIGQIRELEGKRFPTDKGIIGQVLKDKKAFSVPDYSIWPNRLEILDGKKQRAVMGVPIFSNTEIIGVLVAHDVIDGRVFTESDANLLSRMGRLAGAEIKKAHTLDNYETLLLERDAISDVTKALVSELYYEQLLETMLESFAKRFGYNTCAILLKDQEKNELYFEGAIGYPDDIVQTRRIKIDNKGKGITALVARTGKPKIVSDVDQEPLYLRSVPGSRSEIAVPLTYRGDTIGVLNVENAELHAFDERDLRILIQAAAVVAVAIKNAKLFTETTDRLRVAKGIALSLTAMSAWAHDAAQHTYTLGCDADNLMARLDELSLFDKPIRDIAKRIGEEAINIKGLIPNTLTDLSQKDPELVYIGNILRDIEERREEEFQMKRIQLNNQLSDLPPVLANIQAVYAVCDNLIQNAIRAMPNGGQISFSGRLKYPRLYVEVVDTGEGIDPAIKDDLYIRRVRSTNPQGTGIGSLLTRSYLIAYDGDIELLDSSPSGTKIGFYLPIASVAVTT